MTPRIVIAISHDWPVVREVVGVLLRIPATWAMAIAAPRGSIGWQVARFAEWIGLAIDSERPDLWLPRPVRLIACWTGGADACSAHIAEAERRGIERIIVRPDGRLAVRPGIDGHYPSSA